MVNSTVSRHGETPENPVVTESETCPGHTRTGMGVVMLPPSVFRALDSIVICDTAAAEVSYQNASPEIRREQE